MDKRLGDKMKIIEKTYDATTQQETISERDETAEERDMRLAFLEKVAQMEAEDKAKAEAKATAEVKLKALGLTTDDLKALGL
jgi:hypothetical protein